MSPRDNYIIAMEQAVEPVGDSCDDFEILTRLSRYLGVENKFTEGRTSEDWQQYLYETTREQLLADGCHIPAYEDLRRDGWHKIKHPEKTLFF